MTLPQLVTESTLFASTLFCIMGYRKCWANFSFHTASAHPAVMGTWWNEKLEN